MKAYGVRASFADFEPGVISAGERTFDLAQALRDGNGSIVVPDDGSPSSNVLVAALDAQPALKPVSVRSAEETAREAASETARELYDSQTQKELQAQADRAKLELPKSASKAELIDALVANAGRGQTQDREA